MEKTGELDPAVLSDLLNVETEVKYKFCHF